MNDDRPRHAAATDARVRQLLAGCLDARGDLTSQQRTSLAEDLLSVVWQAIRIKRPIWRPEDFDKRDGVYKQRINERTRSKATQHCQPYTSNEIETLMRDDMTDQQIAEALGRSFYAIKTKRRKIRAASRNDNEESR